jgi:hypothetical protein
MIVILTFTVTVLRTSITDWNCTYRGSELRLAGKGLWMVRKGCPLNEFCFFHLRAILVLENFGFMIGMHQIMVRDLPKKGSLAPELSV